MVATEGLIVFAVTTGLVCFTPGPAALAVASSAAVHGRRHIPAAVLGICCANIVFFGLSALGISTLLAASPQLFAALRIAGAAYLIVLGLQLMRAAPKIEQATCGAQTDTRLTKTFGKAFAVEASNPKALLYFGALLPQFIVPGEEPLLPQLAIFCVLTFFLDIAAYSFYGLMGLGIGKFAKGGIFSAIRRSAGAAFLICGIRLARG